MTINCRPRSAQPEVAPPGPVHSGTLCDKRRPSDTEGRRFVFGRGEAPDRPDRFPEGLTGKNAIDKKFVRF